MRILNFKVFQIFALIFITLLGCYLYSYKLGEIPSGFYIDEAVTGYNAYSILQTGKDEYGKAFPWAMRFFGSYSPPLYTYLTAASVKFFGLTITAVRLPSVILGVASIFIIFIFLKNIPLIKSPLTPLLGAFLFTLSPWNLFYARTGYEVYLGFFLFSLGILFLWLGFQKKSFLNLGLVILSFSTYGAHTERFLIPLFIVIFCFIFRKISLWGLLLALIVQIPNILLFRTSAFFTKGSLFYSSLVVEQAKKMSLFPLISIPLAFVREFLSQAFVYLSPRSLFFTPDPDPQRSMPELSTFYFWLAPLYVLGLCVLWKNKQKIFSKFISVLVINILLLVALTADPFSTQRALPLLLPIILIICLGLDSVLNKARVVVWVPAFILLTCVSLLFLWRSYFVFLPTERAKVWGYGFHELAQEIQKRPDKHFVIDQTRTKPAYIELAFFMKYPPEKFQAETERGIKDRYYTDLSFNPHYKFANIETRNLKWEEDIYQDEIVVGDELTVSQEQASEHFLTKVFEIKDPVSNIIFVGWQTNPSKKCRQSPSVKCSYLFPTSEDKSI